MKCLTETRLQTCTLKGEFQFLFCVLQYFFFLSWFRDADCRLSLFFFSLSPCRFFSVCSRNFLIEEGLTGSDGNVGDIVYFKELVCRTLSAVKIEKYGAYSKRKQHKAHFCHYAFDKFVDEVERIPRPTVSFLCCVLLLMFAVVHVFFGVAFTSCAFLSSPVSHTHARTHAHTYHVRTPTTFPPPYLLLSFFSPTGGTEQRFVIWRENQVPARKMWIFTLSHATRVVLSNWCEPKSDVTAENQRSAIR